MNSAPTPTPQGTPRTESQHIYYDGLMPVVDAGFARTLERELSTAQARASAAEMALARAEDYRCRSVANAVDMLTKHHESALAAAQAELRAALEREVITPDKWNNLLGERDHLVGSLRRIQRYWNTHAEACANNTMAGELMAKEANDALAYLSAAARPDAPTSA